MRALWHICGLYYRTRSERARERAARLARTAEKYFRLSRGDR